MLHQIITSDMFVLRLTKTPWMEELLVKISEDQTSSAEDQNQPIPAP